ncbi:membrane protein [Bordetella pertussis]|nr:membrane protein [Bordetella pertussis]CFU44278.1 membrane protein [Bordetella pertussis]
MGRLPLLKVDMTLDDRRQVAGFEGLLARELTLGEMTYPTGTRVASAPAGLAQAQAGDLLFSPSRGRAARRGAGTEIVAGKSVLQAPDGTVRAVLANRDAGVLDFAAVRMAP